MSSPSLLSRARARNPLPHGAATVGVGLTVAGLTIYVFLAIAARGLGPERYAALSTMWSITFLAAPGIYFPVEQEVSRAVADRRARGLGGGPVITRAATLAGSLAILITVAALGASGFLIDQFFAGDGLLLLGFVLALCAYATQHLARGSLSGNGRFTSYGVVLGLEGMIRMGGAIVLAVVGVATAGPYAVAVGLSPILALLLVVPREADLLATGPPASWRELSRAFGYLLVGSLLAQTMINIAPLVVTVLADSGERDLVGKVLIALIIARVPVFMFQAIQASLIPQLATLAAEDRWHEFRHRLALLLAVVLVLAVSATAAAWAVGPWIVGTFFGQEYRLSSADMAWLAAASGTFMLALALAQALISISGYRRAAAGWAAGVATLFAVTAVPADLLFRVERGFMAGAVAAVAVMAVLLAGPVNRGKAVAEPEFMSSVPIEP